jgi:hypothetical protein
MRDVFRERCACAALLIAGLGVTAAWGAPAIKTRTIDCSKGKSIQAVLDSEKADSLILELSGICQEDVDINRSNVVLRGNDPTVDGIRGATADPSTAPPVLSIHDARNVTLENIGIYDGARHGLLATDVFRLIISNARIEGHASNGVMAFGVDIVRIANTTISAGVDGIQAVGDVTCSGCTIDAGRIGFLAFEGQHTLTGNSTVTSGGYGVFAQLAASLEIRDSSVEGPWGSAYAFGNARVALYNSTIGDGPLSCEEDSTLVLDNTQMLANLDGGNYIFRGCRVYMANGAKVEGDAYVAQFSTLSFEDAGSSVDGSLYCSEGADAHCASPASAFTGTSSCGQCQ